MTTKRPPKINRNGNPIRRNASNGDGLIVFDSDVEREEKKALKIKGKEVN